MENGNLPDGATFPNSTSARALPPSEPLNHDISSALDSGSTLRMSTGPPETITVTILQLAAAMRSATFSCPIGSMIVSRSEPSVSTSRPVPAKNNTMSAVAATFAASSIRVLSGSCIGDWRLKRISRSNLLYPSANTTSAFPSKALRMPSSGVTS